jgi:hypothetical protein
MADNGVIDMAPNSIVVGGLDYNGNPTLKPFSDGARVDIATAESAAYSFPEPFPLPRLQSFLGYQP